MPCLIRHIPLARSAGMTPPADRVVEDLAEAGRYESDRGVYAVFATWHGHRVVELQKHLDRLEDSARRAGFSISLDREDLQGDLRQLLRDTSFGEARFRISATPGSDFLMASIEAYAGPPVDLRSRGVRCGTVRHVARSNPRAKQTHWIVQRSTLGTGGTDYYEQLLVTRSGGILEGASSNFYVIRGGGPENDSGNSGAAEFLQTADDGILPGIARGIVLDVARGYLKVDLTPPPLNEREAFLEAFLTSASRGIVPVVEIDGEPVGEGRPGPVTTEMISRYDRRAESLEEKL